MSHVQMSLLVCLVLLVQQVAAGESVPRDCERVSGGVYCLYGQGGNMGILATDEGLLVVDSKYESLADSVLATIRAISGEPIRYLVNTHYHGDHIGGNEFIGEGAEIIMHSNCRATIANLHAQAGVESGYISRVTEWSEGMRLRLGGETARLLYYGNAHTSGDLVVVFHESKVVHAGDLFFNGWPPYIDVEDGSDTENWIRTIEILCEEYPDHKFIPGHGKATDAEAFLEVASYLKFVRREVAAAIEEGKTREEAVETINLDTYSHLRDPRPAGGLTTKKNVGWVYDEMMRRRNSE